MRNNRTNTSKLVALALIAAPAVAGAAARAELKPGGELSVGQPSTLVITADHDVSAPPAVHVANATVHYNGQMTSTSIVNGVSTRESRFMYTLVPRQVGELDVPSVRVGGDQTSPIHASVSASAARPASPKATVSHDDNAAQASAASHAFLRFDMPKHPLVVGESVPVKIRAYFRGGTSATLQGNPHVTSPAFTLSQLSDKPAQTQVDINGVSYLQATWTAVLSPARPTSDRISVELPVTLAYRVPRPAAANDARGGGRRSLRDLFGDPFAGDSAPFADMDAMFDDPFFDSDPFASMFDPGEVQQRDVTLRATAGQVAIADVPAQGKPATFSGAVGQFALSLDPLTTPLRVGEPVTLTFRVTGSGSFDRVSVPGIPGSIDWKTYGGKTSLEPEAGDPLGGTKTFTQTIVPQRAGSLELPSVGLAYFDTKTRAYRVAKTEPVTVDVAAAPGGGAADPGLASASVRDPGMIGNRVERGETRATLVPLIDRARFWWWAAVIAGLTLVLALPAWLRRSERIRDILRTRSVARVIRKERIKIDRAVRDRDASVFFEASRAAFQARLAEAWGVSPEAITAADISARLGDRGSKIREVFERADGIAFAPGLAKSEQLEHWNAVVRDELANLEVSR